ncbi:MAG: hypothetical protein JF570_03570, partial [Caulobacter sp.]|nr:hypothetical protein [Caulobacter sp.]
VIAISFFRLDAAVDRRVVEAWVKEAGWRFNRRCAGRRPDFVNGALPPFTLRQRRRTSAKFVCWFLATILNALFGSDPKVLNWRDLAAGADYLEGRVGGLKALTETGLANYTSW